MCKPPIICSFASTGRENYHAGMLRLIKSCVNTWPHDTRFYSFDGFIDRYEGVDITLCGGAQVPQPDAFVCHPHSEIPYQFKFGIIQKLREEGYKQIIWLDCSMILNKDPLPLLEQADTGVMAFHNLGHPLRKYISDHAKASLFATETEIVECEQTWGGAIGFDFNKPTATKVFEEIVQQSFKGAFNDGASTREGFVAHRHDQAVMSVIFKRNDVNLYPYGKIVIGSHSQFPFEYGLDFFLICKSIS